MLNIAFYLDNAKLSKTNWTNILKGNPGVGGSEYEIILTAYKLSLYKKYSVIVFAHYIERFPTGLNLIKINNIGEALDIASKKNTKYFIFKEEPQWIKEGYLNNLPNSLFLIPWCHNFLKSWRLDFYSKCPNIKSLIMVGREQADLYRDHKVFRKIDYIYNGFPIPQKKEILDIFTPIEKRSNIVTFMASIMPFKGFHILAKAWPIIIDEVPDAQLYVIGSGKVYDENKVLGKYGIAEESYERVFMPYLTDKEGNILPSVHFMGRMGTEKIEIIKKTKVAVPNPSGDTETFGIGAVEFGIMGCDVITRRCCGYLDTVFNKKNLYSQRKSKILAKYVIKALKQPNNNFEDVYNDIKKRFSIEQTVKEWDCLFEKLENGENKIHDLEKNIPNKTFRYKWLRIIYSYINKLFLYKLPPMIKWSENRLIIHINWLRNQNY